MAHVDDLWKRKDGRHKPAYGKGLRWRVIYEDSGRRRSKSFRTQDAARAFLTSVDHKQRAGEYIPRDAQRALIGDLLPQWEASRIRDKPSTTERVASDVRAAVAPRWAHVQVGKVERRDVQAWVADMHASGLSPRTVGTRYGTFRTFMNWCVDEGAIGASPCQNITLPRGRHREHFYLTPAEVRRLLDAMHPHYRPLVEFLVTTGCRFGEAVELRVGDLDLPRRRAAIARNYTYGQVTTPKTHKRRSVPLTRAVTDTLARLSDSAARDRLVFTTIRGARVDGRNFRGAYWARAVEAAGLPAGFQVKELRHTAASLAVSSGANVKAVQRMLGHASAVQTLDTYADLFSDDLDMVAERMGSLLHTDNT